MIARITVSCWRTMLISRVSTEVGSVVTPWRQMRPLVVDGSVTATPPRLMVSLVVRVMALSTAA